jgi:hypothetical protein
VHLLPAERSGHRVIDDDRVIRYRLADGPVAALLAR